MTAPASGQERTCGACVRMSRDSKFGYYHSCQIYEARAIRPEDDIDCPAFLSRDETKKAEAKEEQRKEFVEKVKGLCREFDNLLTAMGSTGFPKTAATYREKIAAVEAAMKEAE